MSYTKTQWVNNTTPINDTNLNKIEQGIYDNSENIDTLQTQITAVASGSPAGVYATVSDLTTADPDHSKIYIVSADGHWYYYANSQWNDGGQYQASEDSETVSQLQKSVNKLEYDKQQIWKEVDLTWHDGGCYRKDIFLKSEAYVSGSNQSYASIQVHAGEVYKAHGVSILNFAMAVLYTTGENPHKIAFYPDPVPSTYEISGEELEITQDCELVLNVYGLSTYGYATLYKKEGLGNVDKFKNKTILFTGDSITNGYGWDKDVVNSDRKARCLTHPTGTDFYNLGWAECLAEDYQDAIVLGYGKNGAKIQGEIMSNISLMSSNADYIIFSGGINDVFQHDVKGSIISLDSLGADAYTQTFDTTTFAGALENGFKNAINKWGITGGKIGYIITPRNPNLCDTTNYPNFNMDEMHDIIVEACRKWAIPYLDLYYESNLISTLQTAFFSNDPTHPNENGYRKILYPKIKEWLKTI